MEKQETHYNEKIDNARDDLLKIHKNELKLLKGVFNSEMNKINIEEYDEDMDKHLEKSMEKLYNKK